MSESTLRSGANGALSKLKRYKKFEKELEKSRAETEQIKEQEVLQ